MMIMELKNAWICRAPVTDGFNVSFSASRTDICSSTVWLFVWRFANGFERIRLEQHVGLSVVQSYALEPWAGTCSRACV